MFRFFIREKYTILLVMLFLNVIAAPFFSRAMSVELFLDVTFTMVMISAIFSISKGKKAPLAVSVLLMLPCLFFIWWIHFYTPIGNMRVVSICLQALFVVYVSMLIVVSIFHASRVNRDVISAAIVVYLFISVFFYKIYLILELTSPGSFTVSHAEILSKPGLLRYFSLVTLSTLGYGDISPVTPEAQAIASIEAIFGQIYLAVLVARLVSIFGATAPGKTE
ncbi:MAG: ion channel [Desulfobacterales bacterium]|nr:ion channel [Desulfobacterales bacterium]